MRSIIVLFIVIILCYSCNNRGSNNSGEYNRVDILYDDTNVDYSYTDTIKIQTPLNVESKFFLDSVCSNYSFIVLETSEQSLIGEIDKVFFTDSLIFIGDFKIQKSIFVH